MGDLPATTAAVDELSSIKSSLLNALGTQPTHNKDVNGNGDAKQVATDDSPAAVVGVAADFERAIDILTTLQQRSSLIVNVDSLAATKIGHLINSLRKHEHVPLQEAAKALMTQWKSMVRGPAAPTKTTSTPSLQSAKKVDVSVSSIADKKIKDKKAKKKKRKDNNESSDDNNDSSSDTNNANDDTAADTDDNKKKSNEGFGSFLGMGHTKVVLRDKIQRMFSDAIGLPPAAAIAAIATTSSEVKEESISSPSVSDGTGAAATAPSPAGGSSLPQLVDIQELAVRCEAAIFSRCHGINPNYKAKVRDLIANLQNPKNEWLRADLYCARLAPETMAGMSSLELADPQLKAKREKERKYNTDAKRSDYNEPTGYTDQFQCERCRQSKCTFFQMQTRGSDEPMTIFVTCLNCGFKFRSGDNA